MSGDHWTDVSDEDVRDRIGREVIIERGQFLRVRLGSNPTTGFSWSPIVEQDPSLLKQLGTPIYEQDPSSRGRKGGGGTETFLFKAVAYGKVDLKFSYRRPWEKDTEPFVISWPVNVKTTQSDEEL